jgi:hypothetical protein
VFNRPCTSDLRLVRSRDDLSRDRGGIPRTNWPSELKPAPVLDATCLGLLSSTAMDPLGTVILIAALLAAAGVCALIGHLTARLAASKGYSYKAWFWWGVFLPIPTYIFAAFAPGKEQREREASDREAQRLAAQEERRQRQSQPKKKRCPDCAETIQYEARVCKHCGFRFDETPQVSPP